MKALLLPVLGLAGLLVIAGCSSSGTGSSGVQTGTTSGATTSAKPSAKSSSSKAQPKTRDNSSARLTKLGAGTYTVGADVPPGRYVITAAKGESGNLSATTDDDPLAINEILGDAGGLGVPSVTTSLVKKEVIKIEGLSHVTFRPASTRLRKALSTGDWEVGLDIAPGRYVATPKKGQSGNFTVYDTDGLPATNEVLGKAGGLGVPNVTLALTDKEEINISGISIVTFIKK
jgi:hypothetical protein